MRRPPLSQCCPYFGPQDQFAGQRLNAMWLKHHGRAALMRAGVTPRLVGSPFTSDQGSQLITGGRALEAARLMNPKPVRSPGKPVAKRPAPTLFDPECEAVFDANTKLTTITAMAATDCSVDELAELVDPRAWGLGSSIIDVAFPVVLDVDDRYQPAPGVLDVELGTPWEEEGLLFEYACSDVASFENILRIVRFDRTSTSLRVEYELHDCLKTTIGFFEMDGGMQRNEGFVQVDADSRTSSITVVKRIRIRDLTPNDPGNRYDFGESVNSTIGAALSVWVDDTSMMSPVF